VEKAEEAGALLVKGGDNLLFEFISGKSANDFI